MLKNVKKGELFKKSEIMTLFFELGVVAVILVCALAMYNSFVQFNNKVKEAFATKDV